MSKDLAFRRTRAALLASGVFNEPLLILYNLAAIILHKDLHASVWQIAVLTMLRPMTSLLSLYWSASVFFKRHLAVSNVVWAGVIARIPFLFFPWFHGTGFFITSVVLYMMLYRGAMPAWLEIIRTHLPSGQRERNFSLSSILAYTEGVLLGIGVGSMLDLYPGVWRWLFPLSAIIGFCTVFMQIRIPRLCLEEGGGDRKLSPLAFLIQPWKEAWGLLRAQRDFARFQWAMMLFGIGIMIIQPALPFFFVDNLHLSYTDLAVAFAICRGVGFAFSSNVWAKGLDRSTIYPVTSAVFVLMATYPLFMLFAVWHVGFLYLAYVVYGVAQAGVHLSWNLSGPLFAKEENSTLFSTVNIVGIGVRGAFVPMAGSGLCVLFGPITVLFAGVLFSAYAAWKMGKYALEERQASQLTD